MLYPKIEDCVARVGCKYTLAVIAAKRSRDLTQKSYASFVDSRTKEITYALQEISDERIVALRGVTDDSGRPSM